MIKALKKEKNERMILLNKVAVIGGGNMGAQIAIQSALFGMSVSIYVRSEESKERFKRYIKSYQEMIHKMNKFKVERILGVENNITILLELKEAISDADIIIESIIENLEIKKKIFKQVCEYCKPTAIITTNTSTFIPSMFIDSIKTPENFACMHFHTYVWNSSIVEIMPHPGTSKETVKILRKFTSKIGQVPLILKKENANYVFNSIMMEINRAALTLVTNEVATIKDIDMVWRGIMKISNGPFAIMDMVGLDTIYEINNYWADKMNDTQLKKNSEFLKGYIEAGKLGVKTREGFYKY